MNQTLYGMREGALTLAYNGILTARRAVRQLTRPTEIGVRVMVPRGREVLLVRHRGGRRPWALPGGGVHRGESLPEASLREVYEEARCRAEPGELLGIYHSFGEGMTNFIAVFVCAPLTDARPPVADLEIVDARFFPRHDLPANIELGSRRRIAEYERGERGLAGPWYEPEADR